MRVIVSFLLILIVSLLQEVWGWPWAVGLVVGMGLLWQSESVARGSFGVGLLVDLVGGWWWGSHGLVYLVMGWLATQLRVRLPRGNVVWMSVVVVGASVAERLIFGQGLVWRQIVGAIIGFWLLWPVVGRLEGEEEGLKLT